MATNPNTPPHLTKYPEFVAYHFLDPSGKLLAMVEDGNNTDKFLQEGLNIDGSSIGVATVEKSDLKVMPEKELFQTIRLPGSPMEHHRFVSHLVDQDGNPHPLDPRNILKKQVDKAHNMGFEPYMFSEIEFYIVDEATHQPIDKASYCSLPPYDKSYQFRQELGRTCKELGMQVKRIHHECGPGQNEIELNLTPCMKNADDTVLCMWVLEMMAHQRKQKIVFSPKPFADEAGNGLHHHILLRNLQTGENAFAPAAEKDESLSKVCRSGIAGLLQYSDEITAVMGASPETFVRLRPGFEAPNLKAWGFSNRTALVRVPATGSTESTRFEYRGGDLSGSVHSFGAVLLAAVLKGIEDDLEPPASIESNTEHLSKEELQEKDIDHVPLSFNECLYVLETSNFLREAFGEDAVNVLIERDTKLFEAQSF
ncbi:MAG: hypothetical protein SGILL_003018 [Bacillariaceae sp.]